MNESNEKNYVKHIKRHLCVLGKSRYTLFEQMHGSLIKMAESNHSLSFLYDLHLKRYSLVDLRYHQFVELDSTVKLDKHPTTLFYDRVHPDDINKVVEADRAAYDFFTTLDPKEYDTYELVSMFRILKHNGKCMRVFRRTRAFNYDNNGKLWMAQIMYDIMEHTAYNKNVCAWMFNRKDKLIRLAAGDICNNVDYKILPDIYIDLLKLAANGDNTTEMAEKLFVSVNTIYGRHQCILDKIGTRTLMQSLYQMKLWGLI